jgi:REP element-mobilizing transposase RayT
MPWGLTRFHHSGQSHFVTFCCYHRGRLLTTDASRQIFESALERVRRSFRLHVYGYVVMPEHVHLLLSETQEDTSGDRTAPLKPKTGLSGPPVDKFDVLKARLKPRPFKAESVIAAVNRYATQNQTQDRFFQHSVTPRPARLTVFAGYANFSRFLRSGLPPRGQDRRDGTPDINQKFSERDG